MYFSRTLINDGKDYGENAIEEMFVKEGYTVVHPEMFSFDEQVQMLSTCTHFAATEGSISHNVVFTPRTEVVIIRKSNYINSYQVFINELADVDVTYIDSNYTLVRTVPWCGPFFV